MRRFLLPLLALAAFLAAAGTAQAASLTLENSFVSSRGWVKPGDTYPFTLTVRNPGSVIAPGATVTVPAVPGMRFVDPAGSAADVVNGALVWRVPDVMPVDSRSLVVEAKADTLAQDPELAWKDLSTVATLTGGASSTSHGPRVIPPGSTYETARYGDRPFPVVPVKWYDREPEADGEADKLESVINSPANPGSTFNLYQEMSLGQLFPEGDVPSAGKATVPFTGAEGFDFTDLTPGQTCHGVTLPAPAIGTPLYANRIEDGWYRLPGTTDYYGDDANGSAVVGSLAGVAALQNIDSGCGPTGKAVYDAAQIADPDIDYSDYDTDKDGVVDFFMMVYSGVGGNGESQLGIPPYDNIWPHSASLEDAYIDPVTGLRGYTTKDQLKDLEGRPLYYVDDSYTATTTTLTPRKVFVRIGPYNVNPESAIDKASVISHEYGHSLGLPDYYSTGSRTTYGTFNLMAEDHSQNMSLVARQQLGWVIPDVLAPGTTTKVAGMKDGKQDTHRIAWQRPDGTPYTLTGAKVHNAQAYVAKLPGRRVIDAAKVPSGTHLFHSGSGNDFGCAPLKGHNLDIDLSRLKDVAAGTTVTLKMKSAWDIEWDFDYGFVMTSTDSGKTFSALPSAENYTTSSAVNPNSSGCQSQYGNGLTGSSASAAAGTATVDRLTGTYGELTFVDDSYDLSDLAGKGGTLRLSYSTDPGAARPGWFVDDLVVMAGDKVLFSTDGERGLADQVYPGGCKDGVAIAAKCTAGWSLLESSSDSPADHAYYMELRDRSGFDFDGKGQDDRGTGATFAAGMLLEYTDENHGDGNAGVDDPPAVSPLDATPEPSSETPNLEDATFGPTVKTFSDAGPTGHVDNYTDPADASQAWRFAYGCLGFAMSNVQGLDAAPIGNLTSDVTFTAGSGCARQDYGAVGAAGNRAPTALFQVLTKEPQVGREVQLDASQSGDDRDAPEALGYSWDLNEDGADDVRGQVITATFAKANPTVRLTVRDAQGLTTSTSRVLTLRAADTDPPPATTTPGTTTPPTTTPPTTTPGITTPGTTTPGATTPGATTPGATTPGASVPGASVPGATAPGATAPGTTTPGTTTTTTPARGTAQPGTTKPPTTKPARLLTSLGVPQRFAGTRALRVRLRTSLAARVTFTLTRKGTNKHVAAVVRRTTKANGRLVVKLPHRRLAKGTYVLRVSVVSGTRKETATRTIRG